MGTDQAWADGVTAADTAFGRSIAQREKERRGDIERGLAVAGEESEGDIRGRDDC